MWSGGKYDRASVISSLRKLDKVVKERGKSSYLADVSEYAEEIYAVEGNGEDYETESADGENYIYLQEGDLAEVMEEEDVMTALASYKEIRQAMKDQKKGRGFYGKGGFAKGKGKGGGKWQKVHTEQLKLRSKCWKCHQIGHWGRECTAEPRPPPSSSASSGVAASVATSKSGFLVVSDQTGVQGVSSNFWLKQYIAEAKTKKSASQAVYKSDPSFCGIVTLPEHGVVDTAAEGGLIGKPALDRLQNSLRRFGAKIKWTSKTSAAQGVGGSAKCIGVAMIPIGLAGVNGILEATVVDGDVPLLLPIRMLTALKAVVNTDTMKLSLNKYGVELDMHELPSGHVTVDIVGFKDGKFSMPFDVPGCTPEDFEVATVSWLAQAQVGSDSAEMAQRSNIASRANSSPKRSQPSALRHVVGDAIAEPNQEAWEEFRGEPRARTNGCVASGVPWHESSQELAGGVRQDFHPAAVHGTSRHRSRLVSSVATFAWLCLGSQGWELGRDLRGDHHGCKTADPAEVEGASQSVNQQLRAPERQAEDGRKCFPVLCGVPGMQCEMGESHDSGRHQEVPERCQGSGGPLESSGKSGDPSSRSMDVIADDTTRDGNGHGAGEHEVATCRVEENDAQGTRACEKSRNEVGAPAGSTTKCISQRKSNPCEGKDSRSDDSNSKDRRSRDEHGGKCSHTESGLRPICGGPAVRGGALKDSVQHGGNWYEPQGLRQRAWLRRLQADGRRGCKGALCADWTYEIKDENGWNLRNGPVPLNAKEPVRVWITLSHKAALECYLEDDKETHFSSKSRKTVNQGLEQVTVSEVFSPPRIATEAARQGLAAGTSFDLVTGWDLHDPNSRKEMWKQLRKEKPELIVICPPCKMFWVLQELNYSKMPLFKAVRCLEIGVEDLETAALVAMWQLKRKKYFILEQPDGARSWEEPCIKQLGLQEGVERIRCDMCAFGMNVDGKGLNLKPTGLMLNSPCIAARMNRRCSGDHEHVSLMGGKAHKAQVYPKKFCQEIVKGIKDQVRADGCWEVNNEVYVMEDDEGEEPGDAEPGEGQIVSDEAGEGGGPEDIVQSEKDAVMKLHRGIGHPALPDFIRFMKAARIRGEIVRWAAKSFKCETCDSRPKTKAVRPATIPKTYQPNKVLGIDLIYIPAVGGQHLLPALSMLDWGSNYQMVELLPNKEPGTVWQAMWQCWTRTFGLPEVIVCDAGKEFAAEFVKTAAANGVVVFQVGARAPWQNGKTERHGDHYKELLQKARSETVLTSEQELKMLMQEVESVKNRYSNRSGFAPIQRQIGQWPRAPTEITSDEVIDPALVSGALVDDLERQWEMRRIAQKAFVEHNARKATQKALQARSRISVDFQPGDFVYIYRVHRLRKRKHGANPEIDYAKNKPTWVGPGTVVAPDGANLWITVWGELWKVAREQCRLATNLEKHGIELVMSECKDIVEEYKRTSKKAGYKDITDEPFPPLALEDGEVDDGCEKKVNIDDEVESIVYSPSVMEEADEDVVEVPVTNERRVSVASRATQEEPEAEVAGVPQEQPGPDTVVADNQPTPQDLQNPGFQEGLERSEQMADRLDGLPQGWRMRHGNRSEPYFCWVDPAEEEEYELEEARARANFLMEEVNSRKRRKGDYWIVDKINGTATKFHNKKRKSFFDPAADKHLPFNPSKITMARTTTMHYLVNRPSESVQDQWKSGQQRVQNTWWTGSTTFQLKDKADDQERTSIEVLAAEKRRSDDVDMRKESPKDLQEWKVADLDEWKKVTATQAVRVLSLEESRQVRTDLRSQGKFNRILPTKIARRYKPAEQPGEPTTKKSRLCIRGDLDPDILTLERFSPTVNTMNLAVLIQIAANENMTAQVGDLKNAFCQSGKLERKEGKLYFRLPPEGVEGVHEEQLVEIIAGCYGLVDAPLHWRKSLTEQLKLLGYVQSTLDPCIYKLYSQDRLQGMIAIEVDDLFMVGHAEHIKKMDDLRKRFVFGKFVTLKQVPEGAAFNGRRVKQLQNGEFQIDMQKFVEERLHEVVLDKGRVSQKKADATPQEVSAARTVCGALNWLAKEGRPDAAGPASLLSSKLASLKIEDICLLNDVVKNLKKKSDLILKIQPLSNMKFSVVSDASFGNNHMHSQGGQMILCHESGLQENQRVRSNLLWWRSGRLQRVVNSTLAAETQSLSRGIGDLLWAMVLFEELRDQHFSIREWPQRLCGSEVMALASSSSSERLKGSLAIVDAKSLYDQLCKDSIGGQDKRTAIEIQIIREDLTSIGGKVRWIDHPAMLADPLTKIKGSCEPLYRMLSSGEFQLVAETEHMEARNQAKENGQSNTDIRRFGVNRSLGSCEMQSCDEPLLTPNPSVADGPTAQGP